MKCLENPWVMFFYFYYFIFIIAELAIDRYIFYIYRCG